MCASVLQLNNPETLEQALARQLPDTYDPATLRHYRDGGTRHTFLAGWGPQAQETRIIKLDRENLTSPRAKRHAQRKYNTKNELETQMQIPHARRHHILKPLDYGEIIHDEKADPHKNTAQAYLRMRYGF